ncbi:MAG: hypothetical protein JWN78_3342 [Bacteroidota bacterium]|nr:hypothetical protein [Bacteroidota bacterium]
MCDRGAMSQTDENMYYETVLALESLAHHNIKDFSWHINNARSRPGEMLLRILPAALQGILFHSKGISPANPDSLKIPVYFNIIINLLVLFVLFKLAELLFRDENYALLSVVLYKCLANSNLYIRHVFPYEKGLLCFLFILYFYLKNRTKGNSVYFILGLFSSLTFAIYPGYYFVPVFLGLMVFINDLLAERNLKKFIIHGIFIFLGFFILSSLFELLARIGETSYLGTSNSLAETIDQGSFNESLIFPVKYLIHVEDVCGILILSALIIFIYLKGKQFIKERQFVDMIKDPVTALFMISITGMIFHGLLGSVFHKMVYYGRLMHLYFPLLVLFLVYVIFSIKNNTTRRIVSGAVATIFLIHFFIFSSAYFTLGYPKNMLYNLKIDNRNFNPEKFYNETQNILFQVYSPNSLNRETNSPYTKDSNYILVNCCFYYPLTDPKDFKIFVPEKNLICIGDKPDYQAFTPYTFEGFSPQARINFAKRKYRIKFYKVQ